MLYLLNRLKEASTWAGIATILVLFGINEEQAVALGDNIPAVIGGILALVAVFAPNVMGKAKNNPIDEHGMTDSKAPVSSTKGLGGGTRLGG